MCLGTRAELKANKWLLEANGCGWVLVGGDGEMDKQTVAREGEMDHLP